MLRAKIRNFFQIFFSENYKKFYSSYLDFRKRVLRSKQISLSLFIIAFMLTVFPQKRSPIKYYIYLPAVLIGNNIISCCLLRFKRFEALITPYMSFLQMLIPMLSLDASLSLIVELGNESKSRSFFVGLQIGLVYSISFLTTSSSLHKFLMSFILMTDILLKQYLSEGILFGSSLVIVGILIFINYIYFRNEILNFSVWTSLMKSLEGLRNFEKLIQIFPNPIVILDRSSLESGAALYINSDAQRLQEELEVFARKNRNLRNFLERFEAIEELSEKERAPKRSLTNIIDQALTLENFSSDFQVLNFSVGGDAEHKQDNEHIFASNPKTSEMNLFNQKWEIKIGKIKWEQADALILIFRDISKSEKIKELKVLHENKDKLLATVSHELRTPLNGIIGMIDVSDEELFENPEAVKGYLEIARNSAKNLLLMINDILDISQIRKGNIRLILEWTNLSEAIKGILPLIAFQAKIKHLEFIFENACPEGTFVFADPMRLQQVLTNLLGNACKFTKEGQVRLKASLVKPERKACSDLCDDKLLDSAESFFRNEEIDNLTDENDRDDLALVEISVEDTGVGIQEKDKRDLFQLFGKIETEAHTTGVGLGLAISQGLTKKMSPTGIKFESTFGKGSRFFFSLRASLNQLSCHFIPDELPQIPLLKNIKISEGGASPTGSRSRKNLKRILVVDDDHINHIVIDNYLKSMANSIISDKAYNGEEAIRIVEANARNNKFYNLFVMDCDMPVMNGFQATARLREFMQTGTHPSAKIVALTANASLADKDYCLQQGMDEVWTKPISREEFIKRLRLVI